MQFVRYKIGAVIIFLITRKEKDDIKRAIIILDEFSMTEPDLIITPAVRKHIKELVKTQ